MIPISFSSQGNQQNKCFHINICLIFIVSCIPPVHGSNFIEILIILLITKVNSMVRYILWKLCMRGGWGIYWKILIESRGNTEKLSSDYDSIILNYLLFSAVGWKGLMIENYFHPWLFYGVLWKWPVVFSWHSSILTHLGDIKCRIYYRRMGNVR